MNSLILALALLTDPTPAPGAVVINEILYHAPNDLDLEYVEIYNGGEVAVDLGGWKFTEGIDYAFPAGATIAADSYLVLARRGDLLEEFYDIEPFGIFGGALANNGETLTLTNKGGVVVDSVRYGDRSPWPLGADGYSSSLERICPTSPAGSPDNWVPSPASDDIGSRPAGTPGARNRGFSPSLPPVVKSVSVRPAVCRPGEAIGVEAVVEKGGAELRSMDVLYRVVEPGREGEEVRVPMERRPDGRYSASVPTGVANRIVRIRVRATDASGASRLEPPSHEVRPAHSVWVADAVSVGKIPVVQFFNVGSEEFSRASDYLQNQRRFRGGGGFRDPGGFRGRPRNRDRRPEFDDGERPRERRPGFEDEGPRERFGGRRRGGRGPFGGGFGRFGSPSPTPLPSPGHSAFVYTDPGTGETRLFDFVHIVQRKSGYKLRLNRDRPLDGATTLNFLYEPDERSILNEALAYDLYRLAGNATARAGYARVIIDGQVAGYHLMFVQPNGAFFRRHHLAGGNLYKVIWQGLNRPSRFTPPDKMPRRLDIVARHEKKTNPHDGYDDLITLVEGLEQASDPEDLWKLIQKQFDVDQVINYFAVNTLLSHWDGFFNNYFLYHDVKGTGKWMMFPWDQDSTWGHRMGRRDEVFAEMPLTFGMEGDVPPGAERRDGGGGRFGGFGGFGGFGRGRGAGWWRRGGEISRPLLANPQFRRRFLARLEVLARTVYTEEVFGPRFEALRERLEEEVRLRARLMERPEEDALRELDGTLAFFREHLIKRREYILANIDEPESGAATSR